MDKVNSNHKITTMGLVLIIFSTIFGISNSQTAFYQMGYASAIWYVLGALLFFIPTSLMFAEYGSTFKDAHGGIYSWLEKSIGKKWAFIGSFTWLAGWVLTLVSLLTNMWIPLSVTFSGVDRTQTWSLFGLNSNETIGILSVFAIILITWVANRGLNAITQISYFSGIISVIDIIIFVGLSIWLLLAQGGHFAEPITMHSVTQSPNSAFQSPVSIFSFLVYAIFAYAGMETLGGVTDNTKNAKKTFPRAIIIATVFMTLSYVISIFICGISANWLKDLSGSNVNLGNVRYFMVTNLGSMFGEKALHMSAANSIVLGQWISRFMSLTGFISYFGEFLFLIYAPIKSFIEGSPKDFWPKKMTKLNQNGIPSFALWIQTLVVCLIVLGVSFGGSTAQAFYTILTDMNNITTAVPYLFLVVAFPFFKKNFVNKQSGAIFYRRRITINFFTIITMATLALSIIFTSLQPMLDHDLQTAFWTVFGPVFFIIVAWIFYNRANKTA
ncbi:glutamate/gamma-aminobutyrate family transporter YjeM [Apilactobacillus xinyiensis]|uniref:glutamate/gamma-aminobutyrate family transporter YjeM n=1 Tax=Apilactobacillus xinyiensis TaxID=2841032 RepID=UPI001C7CB978|nr:glutamate/gamma-aminobutyrate family transporter YjeM [Apilactobacillus xinyiensis]